MAINETYYCEKCNRTMNEDNFYGSNNTEKYPEGKLKQCKKCITMFVDNFDPSTYMWILQECDVPYVPDEWNKLLEKYGRDKSKLTGMTILGRYLSKMKLKQHKDYRWKDTEFLQELANAKLEQTMKRQGYDVQEIALAVDRQNETMPTGEVSPPQITYIPGQPPVENYFDQDVNDFEDDLTDEEKTYLRLKWGKTYRSEEWIKLEQLYEEMMLSYDIQSAGDINTLKLACKCSLKANQLLDLGDIDGAQKATKMYDSLMKSGKWTAAQNKLDENDLVDSIGELVALCEKEGFIPRYYMDSPNDKIDRVLEDLKQYTQDLITNETGISTMVETAVKQIEEEKEKIKEAAESSEEDLEAKLFNYNNTTDFIEDDDIIDFKKFEEDMEQLDDEALRRFLEEEDDE